MSRHLELPFIKKIFRPKSKYPKHNLLTMTTFSIALMKVPYALVTWHSYRPLSSLRLLLVIFSMTKDPFVAMVTRLWGSLTTWPLWRHMYERTGVRDVTLQSKTTWLFLRTSNVLLVENTASSWGMVVPDTEIDIMYNYNY